MKKNKNIRVEIFLIIILLIPLLHINVNADSQTNALRDKETNTAYITEKSAKWTNVEEYLAELTLKINGTESTKPLDVIIVLDRSGSMDMAFVHEMPDGNGGNYGSHNASSPCLNHDHFYLQEVEEEATVIPTSIEETYYDSSAQRLTVYNEEQKKWVVLDTSNSTNLYYQFGNGKGDAESLAYGAYHFRMENNMYVRISEWDAEDIRSGTSEGIWNHADKDQGCYDRWMEAKKAVGAFSEQLLEMNEELGLTGENANRVALVPFSIRDKTLLHRLNNGQQNYRNWLGANGYFDGKSITLASDATLSGDYNAGTGWTENISDVDESLSKAFTTHSTDYIYGLSEAYNLLDSRTENAKKNKSAVVIFLSDGTPDPAKSSLMVGNTLYAFYNPDEHIYGLTNAIKGKPTEITNGSFWKETTGRYQRHDVDPNKLAKDSDGNIIGAYGQDAMIVTVGYMLDSEDSENRLQNMASNTNAYISIPADAEGTTADYLTEKLLDSIHIPGGRNAVLKDEISKYYYVPEDVVLPEGVTIEGTIEDGQTIVWNIGDVYSYSKENEPTITVPLVLREEYRDVVSTTYYPTNNDNPEPDLTTPDSGLDGEDTGARLYYTNPDNESRYDTIGTPKLPVYSKNEPKNPDPIIPKPTIIVGNENTEIPIVGSSKVVTGDKTNIIVYLLLGFISITSIVILGIKKRRIKK
ncbi:MAG: hypothetical protein ACK5LC_02990 [Coprobacillaceae bacterium]